MAWSMQANAVETSSASCPEMPQGAEEGRERGRERERERRKKRGSEVGRKGCGGRGEGEGVGGGVGGGGGGVSRIADLGFKETAVISIFHIVPEIDERQKFLEVQGPTFIKIDTAEQCLESRSIGETILSQLMF
jgi:hypothetical protein